MEEKENSKFSKILNAGDILVVAFGAMIGWGWVVSSGDWIQSAGVLGAMIAFVVGGIMIFFVGTVYAELTTAIPQNGGAKVFSHMAFGSKISFVCAWAVAFSYIGVVCFEACSLPVILQFLFPGFNYCYLYSVCDVDIYLSWIIVSIVACIFITYTNIRGIKVAAVVQKVLTISIAVVGIMLIIMSLLKGNVSNFIDNITSKSNSDRSIDGVLSVVLVTPFFLFGFEVIPQIAEEIKVPPKKTSKLLLLSIVLAIAFYGCVIGAVGYSMNSSEISDAIKGSGLVTAEAMSKVFNNVIFAKVLIFGGLCGIVTSWNSFLIGGSRALMVMADSNMIPRRFSKIHEEYKTPVVSIFFIGVLSIVSLFLGRKMLLWVSNCASFSCCITYSIISLSFLKLRKMNPTLERPFKVKHYRMIGCLAFVLSSIMCLLFLLPGNVCSLGIQEMIILLIWIALGAELALHKRK